MQPVAISQYVFIGTQIRFLQDCRDGAAVHGPGYILDNIDSLLASIQTMGLGVSMASAAHAQLSAVRNRLAQTAPTYVLTLFDASELCNATNYLRETLIAELQGRYVFSPGDKRFDLVKLVWSVGSLLAPGVYELLPAVAQYDLSEAGICIAFERGTAAAFHALRATEACMRVVYFEHVPGSVQVANPMWKHMVEKLRICAKTPEPVLKHLDHVRENFRNPTDHPEKMYNIFEAQNLFGLCLDAIEQLVSYFPTPSVMPTS